ncbi:unnamed protein product [Toxocara canis]|uniref:Uncharacterized protein n=1 Tax=Toxocara canis TaxID=6265 RepID=A0A3P7H657_TOXCA|nr:unnamed protein product [Toxocara canis]
MLQWKTTASVTNNNDMSMRHRILSVVLLQKLPLKCDSSLKQRGLLDVYEIGIYNEYEGHD